MNINNIENENIFEHNDSKFKRFNNIETRLNFVESLINDFEFKAATLNDLNLFDFIRDFLIEKELINHISIISIDYNSYDLKYLAGNDLNFENQFTKLKSLIAGLLQTKNKDYIELIKNDIKRILPSNEYLTIIYEKSTFRPTGMIIIELKNQTVKYYVDMFFKLFKEKINLAFSNLINENSSNIKRDRIQSLIDALPDLVWLKNFDGVYLKCNKRFESFFGAKSKEIIGKTDYDFVSKELADFFREKDKSAIYAGKPSINEELVTFADDGHNEILETIKTPLFDDNGEIIGVLGIGRDITGRKKAEQNQVEMKIKFETIFKISPDPTIISHLDTSLILDVNDAFLNSTGYLYEEVINDREIISKLYLNNDERLKFIKQLKLKGVCENFECSLIMKDGSIRIGLMNGKIAKIRDEFYVINIVRDITERKKMENELISSEKKYRDLADLLPQVVFETDLSGNIIYANKITQEVLGYSNEDLKNGVNALDLVLPEYKQLVVEKISYILKNKKPSSGEYIAIRKDGRRLPIIIYSDAIVRNGMAMGLRGVVFDISEIKEAQRLMETQKQELEAQYEEYMILNEVLRQTNFDLEIAKTKAEESDRLKTSFIQNMSHEIRTPLNGILGFTNLLTGPDITRDEINEYAEIIKNSGNRLLEIINNVLDIAVIETGQIIVNKKAFSINELLNDLYNFFAHQASRKNLFLKMKSPEIEDYIIKSDEAKLYQIMSNLINNSLKFTIMGGIEFGYELYFDKLEFFVIDTGIGISKEFSEKLFKRFTQEDSSISRAYEVAGLGLAICKGLVEALNGKIRFESDQNKGSKFYFTIPI